MLASECSLCHRLVRYDISNLIDIFSPVPNSMLQFSAILHTEFPANIPNGVHLVDILDKYFRMDNLIFDALLSDKRSQKYLLSSVHKSGDEHIIAFLNASERITSEKKSLSVKALSITSVENKGVRSIILFKGLYVFIVYPAIITLIKEFDTTP